MILAPPAGDAFNFGAKSVQVLVYLGTYHSIYLILSPVVGLSVYPTNTFNLLFIGLIIHHRRRNLDLPRPEYKAWSIAVLANVYLLIAPWYPPSGGANGGDVSFWYGTYLCVGSGL